MTSFEKLRVQLILVCDLFNAFLCEKFKGIKMLHQSTYFKKLYFFVFVHNYEHDKF